MHVYTVGSSTSSAAGSGGLVSPGRAMITPRKRDGAGAAFGAPAAAWLAAAPVAGVKSAGLTALAAA